MTRIHAIGARFGLVLLAGGCHGAPPLDAEGTSTGEATVTTSGASTTTGPDSTSVDPDGSSDTIEPLPPPGPAGFVVTLENLTHTGLMQSPLSAGVWAVHAVDSDVLFTPGIPDDGEGLHALAEDGEPAMLAGSVASHAGVVRTGVFEPTTMAGRPGPLMPGEATQFVVIAEPGTRLSLATMLMGSNDLFVATKAPGVSLFGSDGLPLPERDVSASLQLWNAGTEIDQAPGQGPWQALHGGSPGLGPPELPGVLPHRHSTRAIPLGPDLVAVTVDVDPMDPDALILTLTNVSQDRGTMVTALSSLSWALHDDTVELLTEGAPASPELEALAEDGDPAPLDAWLAGVTGVEQHGVVLGPWLPGDQLVLPLAPTADFPRLSLAAMVAESNDAFLAMGPGGVRLFDDEGLRDDDDIADDIAATLTPWDAGTEANEVPGAGLHQAPRQVAPDTGPPEPEPVGVRRYADVTDDLTGPLAGGFLSVGVTRSGATFTITLTNTSDTTAFAGQLSPTVWVIHDDIVHVFDEGFPASEGIEHLAEEGSPYALFTELGSSFGVYDFGVQADHAGPGIPTTGPLLPGDAYAIEVTPQFPFRFLGLLAAIMPSNDTFVALDPAGVALLDERGAPRPAAVVEAEIAARLRAWDAGTEGNQAGAAGYDMAGPIFDQGPPQGWAFVREASEDPIWSWPQAPRVMRMTVAPM
ncbi:spondin domain-containing protein [Paraliomyxa miuraensis]|uniref:spondin domain-containing protein n=1 Tax=Paraliomyxa miuraensis TaxID=376150 RepID=UPI00224D475E|nr:spondin domain-containing protein [Paraliomyxa miuraensis]MCX4240742.1 spondin domain-containing protein [Paraliomyxa miuraensis]